MWRHLVQPTTLSDALRALAEHGSDARIVAGGTDVMVELQRGVKPTQTLIDICALRELQYVIRDGAAVAIGALATHNDLLAAPFARYDALPLAQACLEVGAPQIRARATIAGNVATALADKNTIPALLALDATLVLTSLAGERSVHIADFYDGHGRPVLRPDELIREIRFAALRRRQRGTYVKLSLRRGQSKAVIALGVVLSLHDDKTVSDARIALGCVGLTVVRAHHAEAELIGRRLDVSVCTSAARAVMADAAPVDDSRASAAYRTATLPALLADTLAGLAAGRQADGFPALPVRLQTTPPPRAGAQPFAGTVHATINGRQRSLAAVGTKTLLNALRDDGLTGTKNGCAEGECGACTVWLDGAAVFACLVPAAQSHGATITTIEGLADGATLHPLQQAYIDCGAVQCGFCTPGMIMAGAKLLQERRRPSLADQQAAISGNLCRCTGYRKILDAMANAARTVAASEPVRESLGV